MYCRLSTPTNFNSSNTMASARISACLVDILSWMTAHQLKLNPSKTELLVIPGDPSPAQDLAISLNNSMISPSATARNLGIIRALQFHRDPIQSTGLNTVTLPYAC
ncbi:hypothetical protein QTP86_012252 [Hemibagrus guttatus]|nr:hypothetical protein QTP86_012252 [Hemibagrus guttatus]